MRFLFADSFDAVDADFDFQTEQIRRSRNRQMGDVFPHEVLHGAPYDGILLSRATVECWGGSRFTQAQRMRLFSEGVRQFYRFPYAGFEGDAQQYPIMGDCGAFSYREARTPPCRVPDTVDFYSTCGFTHGVSPDHLILAKNDDWDRKSSLPEDVRERQEFTLISAREFLRASQKRHVSFIPVGAAQALWQKWRVPLLTWDTA
jgi:hypothetical protein